MFNLHIKCNTGRAFLLLLVASFNRNVFARTPVVCKYPGHWRPDHVSIGIAKAQKMGVKQNGTFIIIILLCLWPFYPLIFITRISSLENTVSSLDNEDSFKLLIEEVMIKFLHTSSCVAVVSDPINQEIFVKSWFRRFGIFISFIMV